MIHIDFYGSEFYTQYHIMGQANTPYQGTEENYSRCRLGCYVDYAWIYEEGNLGAWGMLNLYENQYQELEARVTYINAKTNVRLHSTILPNRNSFLNPTVSVNT